MNFLMVFIGGGLGSICRYGIARWLSAYGSTFPYATFLANAISCVILGLLMGYHLKNEMEQKFKQDTTMIVITTITLISQINLNQSLKENIST